MRRDEASGRHRRQIWIPRLCATRSHLDSPSMPAELLSVEPFGRPEPCAIPGGPGAARANPKPCTRDAREMHTGCASGQPVRISCASVVHPSYTARDAGKGPQVWAGLAQPETAGMAGWQGADLCRPSRCSGSDNSFTILLRTPDNVRRPAKQIVGMNQPPVRVGMPRRGVRISPTTDVSEKCPCQVGYANEAWPSGGKGGRIALASYG